METGLEHSSLPPLTCGFCQHDNPAGSRYCNACGAPLAAERCRDCGAVNEIGATACQRCGAALGESAESDFFLPLPPAHGTSADQPDEALVETASAARAAAAVKFETPDDDAVLMPPSEVAPRSESMGSAVSADEELSRRISPAPTSPVVIPPLTEAASDAEAARIPPRSAPPEPVPSLSAAAAAAHLDRERNGSSGRALTWGFVLVAMAIAAYFAYQHFHRWQPSDAVPQPLSAREATGRAVPAVADKPGAEPVVAAKPAAPTIFAPDREPQTLSQAKATGGGGADTLGNRGGDHAAPKTATAGAGGGDARLAEKTGAVAQHPSGSSSCTDALAALALCTPENNPRREP